MTITGVAERAGVSAGTIYRCFEDKEQLITALVERREEHVAERLHKPELSLSGVMDAYAHALLQSFADSSNLFPELLRAREPRLWARGPRPSPKSTDSCSRRQLPTLDRSVAPTRRGS